MDGLHIDWLGDGDGVLADGHLPAEVFLSAAEAAHQHDFGCPADLDEIGHDAVERRFGYRDHGPYLCPLCDEGTVTVSAGCDVCDVTHVKTFPCRQCEGVGLVDEHPGGYQWVVVWTAADDPKATPMTYLRL